MICADVHYDAMINLVVKRKKNYYDFCCRRIVWPNFLLNFYVQLIILKMFGKKKTRHIESKMADIPLPLRNGDFFGANYDLETKLFAEFQNFLVIAQVESFIGWIGYNEFTLDRKGVRYEKNVCFIFDPTCNVSVAREFRAILTIIIARYGSQVFTIHWNKQKKKKE